MPKIAIAHLLLFITVLQAVPTVIAAQTSPVPFPSWYANSPEGAQIETSSDANASLMIMWTHTYILTNRRTISIGMLKWRMLIQGTRR